RMLRRFGGAPGQANEAPPGSGGALFIGRYAAAGRTLPDDGVIIKNKTLVSVRVVTEVIGMV
ncbi:hypothetical protein, partial [Paramagnetospirillum caucaseum]|uniref:hypothetical protein n=1 Tax=Paramagnetospirillum caucaseum TaxID=1244869 RepID=UPI001F1F4339